VILLAIAATLAAFVALVLGVVLRYFADKVVVNERWPDADPTLDVQSHVGDSRPLR
jgi:hypothetical protein